ncbi:MAG: pilus assembly protein PilM [Planctomycetes bacterium]|nr:pilus assembly protein PilM [Planctomycetota bacterium]
MGEPQARGEEVELAGIRAQLRAGLAVDRLPAILSRSRNRLLAVELNSYALKSVVRTRTPSGFALSDPRQYSVPAEFHQDRARRARFLGEQLRAFLRGSRARDFLCVLPSSRVRTTVVDVPPLGADDTLGALAIKSVKLTGGLAAGWHVHATRLARPGVKENPAQRFLLTAYESAESEELGSIFQIAGALPLAMTTSAAAYQALMPAADAGKSGEASEEAGEDDAPVWVVVEMHRYSTGMHIYRSGGLVYTRVVQFGGNDLTRALMDTVATRSGFIELSFEQAEQLKETFGLPAPGDDEPLRGSPLLPEQLRMMYEPKLNTLVYELRNSIRYYQQLSGDRRIHRLILTGGSSRMKGLDQHLFRSFKINPQLFSAQEIPFAVDARDERERAFILSETPALSGALHGNAPPEDILPREVRLERRLRAPTRVAVSVFLGAAALLLALGWRAQGAAAAGRDLLPAGGDPVRRAGELAAMSDEGARIDASNQRLMDEYGAAPPIAEILADVARRMPAEATATQLRLAVRGTSATLYATGSIDVRSGETRTPRSFLGEAFESSPFVRSMVVKSLIRRSESAERNDFEVECALYLRAAERLP